MISELNFVFSIIKIVNKIFEKLITQINSSLIKHNGLLAINRLSG